MKKISLLFLCLSALLAVRSQAQYKCFYGNLHAHTGYSDGESTPDTAFAYARDVANIDVQALTEHNNGGSFGGVTYSVTPAQYSNLMLVADTITRAGSFVALAGQELGSLGSSGFGHVCVWEAPGLWPYINSDLFGCYSWILGQNRPAMFCHPDSSWNSNFNDLYYYQDYDQAMDLIEVVNGGTVYEDAYLRALGKGWHVGASANQDNHDRDWGSRVSSGNIPLTGIWADTLTKASILDALQARRTTAMEVSPAGDRIQLLLSVDGHYQGDRYIKREGVVDISVLYQASSPLKKLYLYTNGAVSDSLNVLSTGNQLTWQFSKTLGLGTNRLFVKAVQADLDQAWTSPVFVEVISQNAINNFSGSQVATWPTPVKLDARLVFVPLEGATTVKALIYDLFGGKVRELYGDQPDQPINWDGKDQAGRLVPNGMYVIRLEQRSATETRTCLGKTMVSR
ncbi:CehA/McbA family metallohydrolase [candidate division TA06 bacterium]|nr:CehA/McbA family metallohydrolase [candidate division TA06 bacterium]